MDYLVSLCFAHNPDALPERGPMSYMYPDDTGLTAPLFYSGLVPSTSFNLEHGDEGTCLEWFAVRPRQRNPAVTLVGCLQYKSVHVQDIQEDLV